jgi:hypothetical protein
MGSAAAALVAAALAACAPVVTHGPAVQPGAVLRVTEGAAFGVRCDSNCADALFPTWGGTLHAGYAPRDPRLPALLGGVTVPVFAPSSAELDLYVQGPGREAPLAYGAGVLLSSRHTMPYVQVGQTPPGRDGWYATVGYARLRRYDQPLIGQGYGPVFGLREAPRFVSTTVSLRLAGRTLKDVYAVGMFGSYRAEGKGGASERRPLLMVGTGLVLTVRPGLLGALLGRHSNVSPARLP